MDSSAALPASLDFSDIQDIISANGYTHSSCLGCHTDTDGVAAGIQGLTAGIPVVWDGSDGSDPYWTVLSRVNHADPAESSLLSKPLGNHHNGGVVLNLATANGLTAYNTILTWIIEGAVR